MELAICKKCCGKPTLVKVSNNIFGEDKNCKYQVVCENCKWEDGSETKSKTGLCKTPESAIRSWNNKNI